MKQSTSAKLITSSSTLIAATILVLALTILPPMLTTSAAAASPNLVVNSQNSNGSPLVGYWTTVSQSGTTVKTGFTPTSFTLPAGAYDVVVADYGGYYFNHWSDGTTTRDHAVTIASSGSVTLTAVYSTTQGGGGGTAPSITVNSQYSDGSALSGLYVLLLQNGATKDTGFTPKTFSVTAGQQYAVYPEDYTNAYFNHWSDGTTSREKAVTATSTPTTLTAIYTKTKVATPDFGISASPGSLSAQTGSSTTSTITVSSTNGFNSATALSASAISGVTTTFSSTTVTPTSGGSAQSTLKIAVSSSAKAGTYSLTVTGTSGSTSRSTIISLTIGSGGGGSGGTSCPNTPGSAGANTVTIVSCALDGTPLTGMYANIRLNGNIMATGYTPVTFSMTPGNQYVVVLYWYGEYYFRHYTDGTLTRYHLVTPDSTGAVFSGMYEHVPASQAAKLDVTAKDTNGNVIGGTTGCACNGTLVVKPGMWMWLTPPGASAPYTGAYTGSSSTPFVVFNGQTYTIQMSSFAQYVFDHWADTGSTNTIRTFAMNGDNVNNIAVYRIVATTSTTTMQPATAATTTSGHTSPAFVDVDH